MSKFNTWKEYVDGRGKLISKPEVKKIADYTGPTSSAPEKGEVVGTDVKPLKSAPAPYKAPGKDVGKGKMEKGFADQGSSDLIYEPKTDVGSEGEIKSTWPKTKTEAFIDKTRNMKSQEFVDYMKENCGYLRDETLPPVTAYSAGRFYPNPLEATRYVAALGSKNNNVLENLVHEIKTSKSIQKLVEALMMHNEFYDVLAEMLEDSEIGPKRSRSLARSMNKLQEAVAPPMGIEDEEDDEEKESEEGDENLSLPTDDIEGEQDDEDMGDMEGEEGEGDEDPSANPMMGDEDEEGEDGEDHEPDLSSPPPKQLGNNNMIDAMKNYKHMLAKMRSV